MSAIVEVTNLSNCMAGKWVHQHLDFSARAGQITAIVGGSGAGKTTLLRTILMLQEPVEGSVKIFGGEVVGCTQKQAQEIRKRWGVLFQQGALFSSLNVLENVVFPLKEFAKLPRRIAEEIAFLKIVMTGLSVDVAKLYPFELSGGMRKRVALARALVMDPELLLLDEPTSGLDPKSAQDFDELILRLSASLDLSIILVSHDPQSLWRIADEVAFLGDGRVLASGSIGDLMNSQHDQINQYFSSLVEGTVRSH
jgi:phospholipid/cholesterol/gamma-HCH transport system ATP-binding protein